MCLQAIIMAAGKGSRLSPLTDNIPKCMIEVGGRPLLDYQLRLFEKYGVDEIIIVTGNKHEIIEQYVQHNFRIKTIYNKDYESTNVLGSFSVGMEYLSEEFIYAHADTIFDEIVISKIIQETADIILPIDVKPCGEEEMKVQIDKNGAIKFINKTMNSELAWGEFLGVAKFSKKALNLLKNETNKILQSQKSTAFFEVAIQNIINNNECSIQSIDVSGVYWNEIDFLNDYEEAVTNFHRSSLHSLFDKIN